MNTLLKFPPVRYTIQRRYKTIEHQSKESGHRWTETIQLSGYEVSGGLWGTSIHLTRELAEGEIERRRNVVKEVRRLFADNTLYNENAVWYMKTIS